MIIEALREAWHDWVVPKEIEEEKEEPIYRDFPTGTMSITTPDGKIKVAMDIVTGSDRKKACKLAELLLTDSKIEIEEVVDFGLTD